MKVILITGYYLHDVWDLFNRIPYERARKPFTILLELRCSKECEGICSFITFSQSCVTNSYTLLESVAIVAWKNGPKLRMRSWSSCTLNKLSRSSNIMFLDFILHPVFIWNTRFWRLGSVSVLRWVKPQLGPINRGSPTSDTCTNRR
jgi:hypothetical protein